MNPLFSEPQSASRGRKRGPWLLPALALILAAGAQAQGPVVPQPPLPAATGARPDPDRMNVELAFRRLDTNADGRLSRQEVAPLAAIANRFADFDTNKDQLLSPDEFAVAYSTPL